MALSVVRGWWIIENWSIRLPLGVDLRGYRPLRGKGRVFGRLKWTDVRTLGFVVCCLPLTTFFFALSALEAADLVLAILKQWCVLRILISVTICSLIFFICPH